VLKAMTISDKSWEKRTYWGGYEKSIERLLRDIVTTESYGCNIEKLEEIIKNIKDEGDKN
jgi:hypothetical protein